jgi:PAS domain S-box-containing protein
MEFLGQFVSPGDFMPHGYCYMWNAGLVWLHVISDSMIALSYFTIPFILLWFVRERRDFSFNWIFVLFGIFILACGATHLMEVWNLWHAQYWLAGGLKALTAIASVSTAFLLARFVPTALEWPTESQWIKANEALKQEIRERCALEVELRSNASRYREQAELLDITHDAMLVRNSRNEITYWNHAAERLYGWRAEETYGKTTHGLLETEFPRPLAEIEAEMLAKGWWEGELIHRCRDGSSVTVFSRWAARTSEDGELNGILESNRDITHRKREERRFRNLLEAAPDGIVIVNRSGQIHLVNAQTEKLFGYSREELVGQSVEILVPPQLQTQHAIHRSAYSHAPRPREMGVELDLYGRRKDGSEFPVEVSLSPLETAEGILITSSIRDVTQRKELAERLRQHEIRFRLLIDAVNDYAIIGLDPSGLITTWNSGAQRLKGYATDEIIGRHVSCLYPLEYVEQGKLEAELKEATAHGHVEAQGWRVRKDGSRFWAEVVTTALHDPGGELIGFVKIDKDITARRTAEEQITKLNQTLSQQIAELAAANQELESFSYSVSHDLRAPLRHIDGFARILIEEHAAGMSSEAQGYLQRIVQGATRMGELVDDLLNLARIGRQQLTRERSDMTRLVKDAISALPPEPHERHIEWRIETLPTMNCDPRLIKLVFVNLLSNAAKFTRKQPAAVIEVGTRVCSGSPAIFVRDNGVGFDPRYADKLFGVFQRLHRQEDFEGTGVGLATVSRIVHRHGGEIWAESKLNAGATFFFTLGPQSEVRSEVEAAELKHG